MNHSKIPILSKYFELFFLSQQENMNVSTLNSSKSHLILPDFQLEKNSFIK